MIGEDDEETLEKYNVQAPNKRDEIYAARRKEVDEIVKEIILTDAVNKGKSSTSILSAKFLPIAISCILLLNTTGPQGTFAEQFTLAPS